MLARLDLRGFDGDLAAALARPVSDDAGVLDAVRTIIADVRTRGDEALRDFTERFDGCRIDDLRVPADEIASALSSASDELRAALEYAHGEIAAYHESQRTPAVALDRNGVHLRELVVPVDRAGAYAPGGRANYPSTVLMTAVPARIAGVPEVVLCVPPDVTGSVAAATLAAAAVAGVDEVYRVGGAQAIAAMAFGTESIRAVDVVVGPGNAYVAAAKREVVGTVGIESLAGPSEIVVVADATAAPELVAIDLLAQAEHGPDGGAALITWDETLADAVDRAVAHLTVAAPRRAEIEANLSVGGRIVIVENAEQALAAANTIAPEHLELMTADPEALVPLIRNAGAVFCGPWAPAAVGDYVAGVNHVLPTAGTARFASALRVDDFCKHVHVVTLDEAALRRVAPHVRALAAVEGLAEHGRSITLRTDPTALPTGPT
jgi:histidinol dehydrogenase